MIAVLVGVLALAALASYTAFAVHRVEQVFPPAGSFVAAQNKELLREKRMRMVEEKLSEAIKEARMLGISLSDLNEMLTLLFTEDA